MNEGGTSTDTTSQAVVETVRRLWQNPVSGAVARLVLVFAGVPAVVLVAFDRNPPLGIFLNGLLVGTLYALLAVGLILIYRTNRIISFAQAQLGAVPAVAGLLMYLRWEVPYVVAVLVVVVGSLALGALVEFAIIRRFQSSPRLILTLATVGLAQLLVFFEIFLPRWIKLRVSTGNVSVSDFGGRLETPLSRYAADIGGVRFSLNHALALVVVAGLTIGLRVFLRRSNTGLAARAVAENVERVSLIGIRVGRVTTTVWMIAALLSASGVFLRSHVVATGSALAGSVLVGPSVLLPGLAAAVIARMERLPTAFVAAMALGMIDQSVFYATRNASLAVTIQLPILLVALLLQRKGSSRAESAGVATWEAARQFRPIPQELRRIPEVAAARVAAKGLVLGLLLALPFLVGEYRQGLLTIGVIYAMIGISLVVLTGWAGQISLGHFAFVGIGAAIAGALSTRADAHFLIAVLVAGLVGAMMAIAVGIPALRLEGLNLAVTTLAFAATTQAFFLNERYFAWLLPDTVDEVPRPFLLGRIDFDSEVSFYYFCLGMLGITVACAAGLRASQAGRVLLAARDNERSAQSYGVNLARTRLGAFAISGFIASTAGAMFVFFQRNFNPVRFTPNDSIEVFAMAVIGGLTSVPGAIAGAAYVVGFRYFLPDYSLLATGLGMLVLLIFFPGGLSEVGFRLRDAFLRSVATRRRIIVPSLLADVGASAVDDAAAQDTALFRTLAATPANGNGVAPTADDERVDGALVGTATRAKAGQVRADP